MRKTTAYARKRARLDAFGQHPNLLMSPITEAIVRRNINEDIQRLKTGAGLHAYTGSDAAAMTNLAGRLVYIVCYAAGVHGLGETPEARILAGTANALAEIAETPQALERQRGAVISGLAAIDRLMPLLDTFSLANGAMKLDDLLHSTQGMGTADVRAALGMNAAAAAKEAA